MKDVLSLHDKLKVRPSLNSSSMNYFFSLDLLSVSDYLVYTNLHDNLHLDGNEHVKTTSFSNKMTCFLLIALPAGARRPHAIRAPIGTRAADTPPATLIYKAKCCNFSSRRAENIQSADSLLTCE